VYSGYIKWIPGLFIDPFIFFSTLLFVVIILGGFRSKLKDIWLKIGAILLLFFIWAFLSALWGTSQVYYIEKIQKSLVILACFFSPFFILRSKERINDFVILFHGVTFLAALIIFVFYIIYGDIFAVFYGNIPAEESTIPNYLALGVFLASGFILAIQKTGKVWLTYKTIIIIAIILLAPRGPLLTLTLFILMYYITNGRVKIKWNMIVYGLIATVLVLYFIEGLTDRLFSRFSDITDTSSSAFSSVGSRIELSNSAIDYFIDSPFYGIGYGSFGNRFTGYEDRIEPHNFYLEIAAETGIIGILLFLLFIISVYYFSFRKKVKNDSFASTLMILTLYLNVQSLSTTYLVDSKALFMWLSILICYFSIPQQLHES
jgi:O-antigen ligase